jgi:transcriptional regulator with XRE-family HTH domain
MPRRSFIEPNLIGIGRRIRELRGAERQIDFAPPLGITQGQLSKMERGETAPPLAMLLRLRERYGVSVDWILTGENLAKR